MDDKRAALVALDGVPEVRKLLLNLARSMKYY
jgi:hypothetical protein